jgi:hypothetical protein
MSRPRPRTILVTALGDAEGSRAAAAALACAGAAADVAPLLIELGGRPPRPTLLTSVSANALESRLQDVVGPGEAVAARGQLCHLTVTADRAGLDKVAAATAVMDGAKLVVLHLPEQLLSMAAGGTTIRPSGVLLRADRKDRLAAARTVRELRSDGIAVSILEKRMNWVAERRALFGAVPPGAPDTLPAAVVSHLLPASRRSHI